MLAGGAGTPPPIPSFHPLPARAIIIKRKGGETVDTQFLLATVRKLPFKLFKDVGFVIPFDEIFLEMQSYGWSKESLEWGLEQLEKSQQIKLAKHDSLIWGVVVNP